MERTAFIFDRTDKSSPAYYPASQTAVLIMDFHGLFVRKVGGPAAVAAFHQAIKLRHWAKSQGMLIAHALIDVNATPFPTCKGAAALSGVLAAAKANPEDSDEPEELRGNPRSEDEPLLLRVPGHVSVTKSYGFDELIAKHDIKSLVLCGLSTSGCVMRTMFAATDAEFVVTVVEDACADPKEGLHRTLVESVLPSRGHCTSLDGFVEAWGKGVA